MIRGEVWCVDFGIPYGSEPGRRRPAVVIQSNSFNASNINTTIVIPLTTTPCRQTIHATSFYLPRKPDCRKIP